MKRCCAHKTRREIERNREEKYKKEKSISREEKGTLKSNNVKYFVTKFE